MKIIFWLSFGILLYLYIIYPLFLALLSKLIPKLWNKAGTDFSPPISFLIPTYNEETVIESKLKNTVLLDYPAPIEIIVADDGSTDSTRTLVSNFSAKSGLATNANRTIILKSFSERQGKMGALNSTIRDASHNFVIFTDANSLFKPDAIKKLIQHFKDPNIGCVGGTKKIVKCSPESSPAEVDNLEGIYWKFENFLKQKESNLYSTFVDGSIYAIRKDVYPFPPSKKIIMDDFAVSLGVINNNYRVVFEPAAIAYEGASTGSFEEFRRKVRILRGAITAIFTYPIKKVAFQVFSHKILRWLGGIFMVALFITNFFITGLFYHISLWLQLLFYGLALIGLILEYIRHSKLRSETTKGIPNIFYIPYYFCLTNFAQVVGFLGYAGNKNPAWEKLSRNA